MNARVLRAHFDGKKIVLDEPIKLKPNTRLFVTVLPDHEQEDAQKEREAWSRLSLNGLDNAYSKDEPEYSLDLIKKPNPDYEGR